MLIVVVVVDDPVNPCSKEFELFAAAEAAAAVIKFTEPTIFYKCECRSN